MVKRCLCTRSICSLLLYRVRFGREVALCTPVFLSQYVPEFLSFLLCPLVPAAISLPLCTYRYAN